MTAVGLSGLVHGREWAVLAIAVTVKTRRENGKHLAGCLTRQPDCDKLAQMKECGMKNTSTTNPAARKASPHCPSGYPQIGIA